MQLYCAPISLVPPLADAYPALCEVPALVAYESSQGWVVCNRWKVVIESCKKTCNRRWSVWQLTVHCTPTGLYTDLCEHALYSTALRARKMALRSLLHLVLVASDSLLS
jgi:hypothetical protein